MNKNTHYVDFSNSNADKITSASTVTIKQETLEEAAERLYPINSTGGDMEMLSRHQLNNYSKQEGMIAGAKWQQERMYSEEEVIEFGEMIAWNMVGKTITESFIRTVSKELFQQFKKK